MQSALVADSSEKSQDGGLSNNNGNTTCTTPTTSINKVITPAAAATPTNACNQPPGGYYDAEKCRAYIANQIRVSKIDRFVAQVNKAVEIELLVHTRLSNILNMFLKRSSQVAYEFTMKCKLGLQRHRQDRILNHQTRRGNYGRKGRRGNFKTIISSSSSSSSSSTYSTDLNEQYIMSNDLLYGEGAQLINQLLSQASATKNLEKATSVKRGPKKNFILMKTTLNSSSSSSSSASSSASSSDPSINVEEDNLQTDLFDSHAFVRHLEDCIRLTLKQSESITDQLSTMRQLFERLAAEHRDQVDLVYAAEEERQSSLVTRRSAYNLSMAAIKATSTPIHVNTNLSE